MNLTQIKSFINTIDECVYVVENDGHLVEANKATEKVLAYTHSELLEMRVTDIECPHLGHALIDWQFFFQDYDQTQTYTNLERVYRTKSGSLVPAEVRMLQIPGELDSYYIIFARKIHEQLQADSLKTTNNFEAISHKSDVALLVVDQNGLVKYLNPESEKILNINSKNLLGQNFGSTIFQNPKMEIDILHEGKQTGIAELSCINIDWDDEPCYLLILHDVTKIRQAEQQLRRVAYYDNLTGLPNKGFFEKLLQQCFTKWRRNPQNNFALLFIDLDNFKHINDSLGHHLGDVFLVDVAQRIKQKLRECDVLSRWGGDEFTVLLENLNESEDSILVAEKILSSFLEPFIMGQSEIHCTPSIGIAVSSQKYTDPGELLRDAGTAMYVVKDRGKSGYFVFDHAIRTKIQHRFELGTGLRKELNEGRLYTAYQPIYDAMTRRIKAAEVLVRWRRPNGQNVSPEDFIPIAEENGLINRIGEFVLREACRFLQNMQNVDKNFYLSVNVSAKQFRKREYIERLMGILDETGVSPANIRLELTESAILEDLESRQALLEELNQRGVKLSMDDFGTGYSSLSYLRQIPFSTVKIDRSFIREIPQNTSDLKIVKAIIAMSHSLNLKVTAEGVETEEQLKILQDNDCDEVQGYLLCRPVPASEFEEIYGGRDRVNG